MAMSMSMNWLSLVTAIPSLTISTSLACCSVSIVLGITRLCHCSSFSWGSRLFHKLASEMKHKSGLYYESSSSISSSVPLWVGTPYFHLLTSVSYFLFYLLAVLCNFSIILYFHPFWIICSYFCISQDVRKSLSKSLAPPPSIQIAPSLGQEKRDSVKDVMAPVQTSNLAYKLMNLHQLATGGRSEETNFSLQGWNQPA